MLLNIAIGFLLVLLTTAIHAEGMLFLLHMKQIRERDLNRYPRRKKIYLVGSVIIMLLLVSVVEMALWAVAYLKIGAIEGVEAALYFSMVTFTTLGYGDITLSEQWRLLGSFEAATGIIMFGWTIALVVATVQRVYSSEKPNDSQSHN
jgi:voltage-gated potassium channel Kch